MKPGLRSRAERPLRRAVSCSLLGAFALAPISCRSQFAPTELPSASASDTIERRHTDVCLLDTLNHLHLISEQIN